LHFTDANAADIASVFTATVSTGDATLTSTANPANVQVVPDGNGGFDVQLSYTYLEELTNAAFSVTVADHSGDSVSAALPANTAGALSVADAPLIAGALTPPTAYEIVPFSNVTVFHFADADPNASASDYTAVVTLGDGNTVTLTSTPSAKGQIVASPGGGFDVQLSYAYNTSFSNGTFGVQVTDNGGSATGAETTTFNVIGTS
jgi:hypothetical protein